MGSLPACCVSSHEAIQHQGVLLWIQVEVAPSNVGLQLAQNNGYVVTARARKGCWNNGDDGDVSRLVDVAAMM